MAVTLAKPGTSASGCAGSSPQTRPSVVRAMMKPAPRATCATGGSPVARSGGVNAGRAGAQTAYAPHADAAITVDGHGRARVGLKPDHSRKTEPARGFPSQPNKGAAAQLPIHAGAKRHYAALVEQDIGSSFASGDVLHGKECRTQKQPHQEFHVWQLCHSARPGGGGPCYSFPDISLRIISRSGGSGFNCKACSHSRRAKSG